MKLREEIRDITGALPDEAQYERARSSLPGYSTRRAACISLTLHAFCQSVLRRFPLEAGIPPQFEVMDERSAAELRREAQTLMLETARRPGPRAHWPPR
ncbi:MAG: hypothetical protein WDN69_04855 [Aliidongia sp.]